MTQTIEHTPPRFWLLAAAVLLVAAAASWLVAPRIVTGLLAGGVWNLVNFWCLSRLLNAWVIPPPVAAAEGGSAQGAGPAGPATGGGMTPHASRRRALGWLLVKFPLLYGLIVLLVRTPSVSLVGFSLGFTAILAVAIGWFAFPITRIMVQPHGR